MKNQKLIQPKFVESNRIEKLAGKIVSNFEGVNLAITGFSKRSTANTRRGVTIDWSNGTFILNPNRS